MAAHRGGLIVNISYRRPGPGSAYLGHLACDLAKASLSRWGTQLACSPVSLACLPPASQPASLPACAAASARRPRQLQ